VNQREGAAFSESDERFVRDLARTIGIALYNQKRIAMGRSDELITRVGLDLQ